MQHPFRTTLAGFLSLFLSFADFAQASGPLSPLSTDRAPLITPAHVQAIYRHLVEDHRNAETGLFISFPGTQDHKLSQQASTYEQAAVGLLAIRLGDIERAKGIFKFMKTAWEEGPAIGSREGVSGLANFYNAEFGGEGIEKTVHLGPNAWAGLFAATLGNKLHDHEATQWALSVARWAMKSLPHNKGGVAMGPVYGPDGIPWPKVYSTENNVSYYAFLAELLRTPELDLASRTLLTDEKNRVETWLVTIAFDRLAYAMNRGTNPQGMDRTRALDTVTWLVSALGPQRLAEHGIDPDRLMRQAQQSFVVSVNGLTGVDATDQPEADLTFALSSEPNGLRRGPARTASDHHRMIWYEGMGQYINALHQLAAYYAATGDAKKAAFYAEKGRLFIAQFDKAALKTTPAETAYPYATYGKFFHDGWYTPSDGMDGPPSSLISAVWRCFAGMGIDPLAGQVISGLPAVTVSAPQIENISRQPPSILYGTSEDMVVYAWQLLNEGDNDHAIQQAQATVQEWASWALRLQEKKSRRVGRLVDYVGLPEQRKEIFSYWALNDVAAAYFILGKAFDNQRHYPQASGAFQQIALHYSLAQVWDPRGWFWSPVAAIREEFVERSPRRYGNTLPRMLASSPSDTGKQPF